MFRVITSDVRYLMCKVVPTGVFRSLAAGLISILASHFRKVFWLHISVDSRLLSLNKPAYTRGLKAAPAVIRNQNSFFEMTCSISIFFQRLIDRLFHFYGMMNWTQNLDKAVVAHQFNPGRKRRSLRWSFVQESLQQTF